MMSITRLAAYCTRWFDTCAGPHCDERYSARVLIKVPDGELSSIEFSRGITNWNGKTSRELPSFLARHISYRSRHQWVSVAPRGMVAGCDSGDQLMTQRLRHRMKSIFSAQLCLRLL
jgi:hypothetical protein